MAVVIPVNLVEAINRHLSESSTPAVRKAKLKFLDDPGSIEVEIHTDEAGRETLINRQHDIEVELWNQGNVPGVSVRKVTNTLYKEV